MPSRTGLNCGLSCHCPAVITFLLPKKGRPEEEQHGIATEPATGSDAKQHLAV